MMNFVMARSHNDRLPAIGLLLARTVEARMLARQGC
jgi:hypothetical protein